MARRKKHEEHENLERWMVSYADFITLLFAFFVVMYSLSAINEDKFRVLAESLAAAFRSLPRSHEPIQLGKPLKSELIENPVTAPPAAPIAQVVALPPRPLSPATVGQGDGSAGRAMQEIATRLERALAPLIEKKLITVRRSAFWLEVEITSNILFASGSAELEPPIVPVLKDIAAILRDYPNPVRVEGFTDDVPINTPVYPSNWELSAARAARVVRLFAGEGVLPTRLAVVGYGEYKPVAPNDTEEGRRRNRKVVIVVLSEEASRMETPEPPVVRHESPSELTPAATAAEAAGRDPPPAVRDARKDPVPPADGPQTVRPLGAVDAAQERGG